MKGKNPNLAVVQMVEQFTGTAYDKLMKIYENLDTLVNLASSLDDLTNKDMGVFSENPKTRLNGDPLETGDSYYNDVLGTTLMFVNGEWVDVNALCSTTETVVIDSSNRVGSDTVITLTGTYTPNSGTLMVFVNQAFQIAVEDDAVNGSYTQTDEKTITFAGSELGDGEIVSVVYGVPLSTVNPVISVKSGIYIAETEDQIEIPLPTGMEYTPGISNLAVYVNGELFYPNVHYVESSSTSITLVTAIGVGDQVIFKQGELVGNSSQESEELIKVLPSNSVFHLNQAQLKANMVIITQGGNTIADGSGGIFTYDPTLAKSKANGVTVIDDGKDSLNQGTGVGNGCWVRQYEGEVNPAWYNAPNQSIECLRYLKPIEGDFVNVIGFYNNTTVGGGIFVWDATKPATEHNGGTIISPQVVAEPGSSAWYIAPLFGVGCWVRQEVSKPSVTWFGVKTDPLLDSSRAFQNAALVGNCEVPSGTYMVSISITGTFYSFGGVTITGIGSVNTITNLLA